MNVGTRRAVFLSVILGVGVAVVLSVLIVAGRNTFIYEDFGSVRVYFGGDSPGSDVAGIVFSPVEPAERIPGSTSQALEALAIERGVGFRAQLRRKRFGWFPGEEIEVVDVHGALPWTQVAVDEVYVFDPQLAPTKP